jgi:SAM-dependent methyltransferase
MAPVPYYLRGLVDVLQSIGKPQHEIRVLEHGCGGGGAALFSLLGLGYTGIYGVDLRLNATPLNARTQAAGLEGTRFYSYDGERLPFADATFDVVFSQQVLEHVAPPVIDTYYSEEARVLTPGGVAYHQVPHRLVPYESHTRTWFIHYLPRPVSQWAYKRLGCESLVSREHLFLRWPWFHSRAMRKHFGNYRDLTAERLRTLKIEGSYDGPKGIRRVISAVVRAPVLGRAAAGVLGCFVMLDSVSIKR